MMNLLLLTFGEKLENHYQAAFSILTFLKDPLLNKVLVITDKPEFYAMFSERVDILFVDQQILTEWKGKHQFFWRIKIKALQYAQRQYPNQHLLYVDSDTFLAHSLQPIYEQLEVGKAFMHKLEYKLGDKPTSTARKMWRHLNQQVFCQILLNADSEMWNAGVIGLPKQKAQALIDFTIELCDSLCNSNAPKQFLEQFAFSLALKHTVPLQSCEKIIGHYWGNKAEWNLVITAFMLNHQLKNSSLSAQIYALEKMDFRQIPLSKKQSSRGIKLKNLIDKIFKEKNSVYFR